ncbi:MAG: SGNH/GDSL hydrolase family protein [Nitrospinota bacterium]
MSFATGKRKFLAFALIAIILSTTLFGGVIVGIDIYLHKRYERSLGLNIWGYRGPILKAKQVGERRVAVLGGSTALGYGVRWEESFPAYLERKLNDLPHKAERGPITVVNLAYNNEGAYSFTFTLHDYEYLDYDVVILYSGYNDLGIHNIEVWRHKSLAFRLTGYLPILPLILREKALILRYGSLEAGYKERKTTFAPNLLEKSMAIALETGLEISSKLERQLGALIDPETVEEKIRRIQTESQGSGCEERWKLYCESTQAAINYALAQGKKVVFVTQPYLSEGHIKQQQNVVRMLSERFGGNPRFRYLDLGRSLDRRDRTLSLDGMHLTPQGNERIAQLIVPTLIENLD